MIMSEYTLKMYNEGKISSQKLINWRAINSMASLPDDMQRILNEVDVMMNEGMVQCVMAPDEETFFATRDALIEQITVMGMDQVNEWFVTNYNEQIALNQ